MNNTLRTEKYSGNDNYGRPRREHLGKLAGMDDDKLSTECYWMIYHAARTANNPRSDYHWMVDACYEESERREGEIYRKAYAECYANHAG